MFRHLASCSSSLCISFKLKLTSILALICLLSQVGNPLNAQSISRQVFGIAGGVSEVNKQKISWTAGETIVGHHYSVNQAHSVTVGFQQPNIIDPATQNGDLKIQIAPNPVVSLLNITLLDPSQKKLRMKMLDQTGRVIFQNKALQVWTNELNMQTYPAGLYYLSITDELGEVSEVYKIVKTQ